MITDPVLWFVCYEVDPETGAKPTLSTKRRSWRESSPTHQTREQAECEAKSYAVAGWKARVIEKRTIVQYEPSYTQTYPES